MLEMIKSTEIVSANAVRKKYPNCHYILTDVNDDLCDLKGKLYCVSYSHDSYRELCEIEDRLEAEGVKCAELGIYDDGYAIGLQHEIVSMQGGV